MNNIQNNLSDILKISSYRSIDGSIDVTSSHYIPEIAVFIKNLLTRYGTNSLIRYQNSGDVESSQDCRSHFTFKIISQKLRLTLSLEAGLHSLVWNFTRKSIEGPTLLNVSFSEILCRVMDIGAIHDLHTEWSRNLATLLYGQRVRKNWLSVKRKLLKILQTCIHPWRRKQFNIFQF